MGTALKEIMFSTAPDKRNNKNNLVPIYALKENDWRHYPEEKDYDLELPSDSENISSLGGDEGIGIGWAIFLVVIAFSSVFVWLGDTIVCIIHVVVLKKVVVLIVFTIVFV